MKSPEKYSPLFVSFKMPLLVLAGVLISLLFKYFLKLDLVSTVILLLIIFGGSFRLFIKTAKSIMHKKFALDYIAILAIVAGLITKEYLVAAIIVLMLASGTTLEEYGTSRAKKSLTALAKRIPSKVTLWSRGRLGEDKKIEEVAVGEEIAIRKGEVIPLDGVMISTAGLTDESSLTGEPYMIEKIEGDVIRSGTINVGDLMVIKVTNTQKDSTYRKIVQMVQDAQQQKAPLIRLADKYSTWFVLITLAICALAYFISGNFERVLAVLVIATPCPLILATPIALMGGMNSAAKKRIIVKRLSSIEVLSKVNAIVFDKTGTITLGKPSIKEVKILDKTYTQDQVLTLAYAIERNSLHPLAKAITAAYNPKKHQIKRAEDIKEIIGSGISGKVDGKVYELSKMKDHRGMAIQMECQGKMVAEIEFEDKIKNDSKEIISQLKNLGLSLFIFTGDKKEAAGEIVQKLGEAVTVKAKLSPEDKKDEMAKLKDQHKIIAMVGDGINDAPALALSHVGMVFSNEEQTAASEAADIVFLGGDLEAVTSVLSIGKRTIKIAMQSIMFGIGLSMVGMVLASAGYIPPVAGAFTQEAIDIAVIFNALRTSS